MAPFALPRKGYAHRSNMIELLERRDLLSGAPPTVVDVHVASTEWSPAFTAYLQTHGLGSLGYRIPTGSSAQTKSLPWFNIDQIAISFSEDVEVDAADLSLSGISAVSFPVSHFAYFSDSLNGLHVATWTFASPLPKNVYQIDLDGSGLEPVVDRDANVLDGDWANGSDTMPSGNGTSGGDFAFSFRVMPGDVNQNSGVEYADYYASTTRQGLSSTSANYSYLADIDGSGVHESQDAQDILSKLWSTYPSGNPSGMSNDAPTTSGGSAIQITNANVDAAISLWGAFADAETSDSQLTYQIVSNSNPSLFDSASINPTTGNLLLNAASGASGRSEITVRATDAGGLSVLATFTVDVLRTNLAPQLNYWIESVGYNTWRFVGYVVDDDVLEGLIVEFTGVADVRASLQADGTFDFAIIIDEENWGWESGIVQDREGLFSNSLDWGIGIT